MFWTLLFTLIISYYFLDFLLRLFKVGNFGNKYVLITGCDRGFGRLLAMRLDTLGFHVFAGCLTEEGAKSLNESCSSKLMTVILDVTKLESIEAALQLVKQQLPIDKGLWALVNNAGIAGQFAPPEMLIKQDYTSVLDVNLYGPIDMTRVFLPLVRKSKGRIVNMTSISGRLAFPLFPYTVSKFGLEGFSDALRRELYSQDVKVCIIEPGAFRTSLLDFERIIQNVQKAYDRSSSEVQNAYGTSAKVLQRYRDWKTNNEKYANPKLNLVVDEYVHAITARFPRTRYLVDNAAKWVFTPLTYLPDRLCDIILMKVV